ncbi:MAG: Adenylate cyclase [Candidatus Ozemobacter sibiricus]|uniref:Adenylate cyclase n=1 Tax=Candidatus Ozemobacter sibiricus TaxID=2268124 RepID=A0A367ZS95_9BACT|nr:MAG: Adenylate cyclase [Candidatus Ozemobacter sibiricus]
MADPASGSPTPGAASPSARFALGLRAKLSVTFALVIILIMLLTVLLVTTFDRGANLERARQNAAMLGNLVKIGMGEDIIRGNYRGLEYALEEFARMSVVRYCVVMNPEGKIMAATDPELAGRYMTDPWTLDRLAAPDVAIRRAFHKGHPVSDACIPVRVGTTSYGMIRVGFSMQPELHYLRSVLLGNLALGLAFIFVGILVSVAVARTIAGPIAALLEATEHVGRGDYSHLTSLPHTDEFQALTASFQKMALELQKRELLRTYVSPHAWEEATGTTGDLARTGQRQEVVVLFCGIRGFPAFAERHPPDEVIDVLNRFLDAMVEPIARFGGIIDKFLGERIMAVFLPAGSQPWSPEVRAVFAALGMQRALFEFNQRQAELGQEALHFGTGLHAGTVVLGHVGAGNRREFTVLGDTVRHAAHLKDLPAAPGGTSIFISGPLLGRIKDFVLAREVSPASPAASATRSDLAYEVTGLTNLGYFIEAARTAEPPWLDQLMDLVACIGTLDARQYLEREAVSGSLERAMAALKALGRLVAIGQEEAKAFLMTFLAKASDPGLRSQAVSMLALAREPRLAGFFRQLLTDPDGRVRANALQALLPLPFSDKAEVLRAHQADDHPRVVANALLGLWLLDDPQVLPGLLALLDSPAPARRTSGAFALATLAGSRKFQARFAQGVKGGEETATRLLDHLHRLLDSDDPGPRRYAVRALGLLGDDRSYDHLGALIAQEQNPEILDEAEQALDRLRARWGVRLSPPPSSPSSATGPAGAPKLQ